MFVLGKVLLKIKILVQISKAKAINGKIFKKFKFSILVEVYFIC